MLLGTNQPNGNVTVEGWLVNAGMYGSTDIANNGVLGYWGVLNGFTSFIIGSGQLIYAPNVNDIDVLCLVSPDGSIALAASKDKTSAVFSVDTTYTQAYVVAYQDASEVSTALNGSDTVHTMVFNTNVAPTETAIRNAIPGGATAWYALICQVTMSGGNITGVKTLDKSNARVKMTSVFQLFSATGVSVSATLYRTGDIVDMVASMSGTNPTANRVVTVSIGAVPQGFRPVTDLYCEGYVLRTGGDGGARYILSGTAGKSGSLKLTDTGSYSIFLHETWATTDPGTLVI